MEKALPSVRNALVDDCDGRWPRPVVNRCAIYGGRLARRAGCISWFVVLCALATISPTPLQVPSIQKATPLLSFRCIVYCIVSVLVCRHFDDSASVILASLPRHFGDAACAQMSHSSVELALQHPKLHQLFDHPLFSPWCDAILLLYRLVALVEGLSVACE